MDAKKLITATDRKYSGSLLQALNDQRMQGLFCDVTVIVEDRKFRAHKNILSACSTYFYQLFCVSGQVVELNFVKADIFAEILNYIYTAKVVCLKHDMVEELIRSGQLLGVPFIAELGIPMSHVKSMAAGGKDGTIDPLSSADPNERGHQKYNVRPSAIKSADEDKPVITEEFTLCGEEAKAKKKGSGSKNEDSEDDVILFPEMPANKPTSSTKKIDSVQRQTPSPNDPSLKSEKNASSVHDHVIQNSQLLNQSVQNTQSSNPLVLNTQPLKLPDQNTQPTTPPEQNTHSITTSDEKTQLTTTPVQNTRLTTTPVQNTRPTTPPVQNTQPTTPPVQNSQPTTPPVQNTRPTTPPVQNTRPTTPPVQNTRPTTPPVQNTRPTTPHVQNSQPTTPPVQNSQPTTPPVQNSQPTTPPVQNSQPTTPPVQNSQPTTPPVQNSQPTTPPVQNSQPTTPPVQSTQPATSVQSTHPPTLHVQITEPPNPPVQSPPPSTQPIQNPPPSTQPIQSPAQSTQPIQSPPPSTQPIQSPPPSQPIQNPPPSNKSVQNIQLFNHPDIPHSSQKVQNTQPANQLPVSISTNSVAQHTDKLLVPSSENKVSSRAISQNPISHSSPTSAAPPGSMMPRANMEFPKLIHSGNLLPKTEITLGGNCITGPVSNIMQQKTISFDGSIVQKKLVMPFSHNSPKSGELKIKFSDVASGSKKESHKESELTRRMDGKKIITLDKTSEIGGLSTGCKVYANIGEDTYDIVIPIKDEPDEGLSRTDDDGFPNQKRMKMKDDDHYELIVDGRVYYICIVCKRSYVCLKSLRRHFNVHSWEKKYPCRYCERVFPLAEYRTKHEINHTGERRYQCLTCGSTFRNYHLTSSHIKSVHSLDPSGDSKLYRLNPCKSLQLRHPGYVNDSPNNIPVISDGGIVYDIDPDNKPQPASEETTSTPTAPPKPVNWDSIFLHQNNRNVSDGSTEFEFIIPESY